MLDPELIADRVRRDLGFGEPRIDVQTLARAMGAEVRVASVPGDGRLLVGDKEHTILLSHRGSRQRQRFTVAHELGHLWLHQNLRAPHPGGDRAEERFCDDFAAALLMPSEIVRRTVSAKETERLGALRRLAETTDTSFASALVRLGHVRGWRSSLLQYRWDDEWRLRYATRVPRRWLGHVGTDSTTCTVLALRRDLGVGRLPLRLGSRMLLADADVEAGGRQGAMALVNLHGAVAGNPRRTITEDIGLVRALLDGRRHSLIWGVAKALTTMGCSPRRSEVPGMDITLHVANRPVVEIKCLQAPPREHELQWLSRQRPMMGDGVRAIVVVNLGFDHAGHARHKVTTAATEPGARTVGYVTTAELLEASAIFKQAF